MFVIQDTSNLGISVEKGLGSNSQLRDHQEHYAIISDPILQG